MTPPVQDHRRPDGASDGLVKAVGRFTEAFERLERARGALYDFHQLVGGAHGMLDEVVDGLRDHGHPELSERIRKELVGLDVIEGRWTFQIVEEFDDGFYAVWRTLERDVRDATMDGRRHVFEAELKEARQS